MSKLRNIILLLLLSFILWNVYGEAFKQQGISGVVQEMESDYNQIKENPQVIAIVETVNEQLQLLVDKLQESNETETDDAVETMGEKVTFNQPIEQTFSIHNIEIGDDRSTIEKQLGSPKRSSLNEYGVNWNAYHQRYENFFMVAYDDNETVAGLYTNQDVLTSTNGLSFQSTKDSIRSTLGEPLKGIRKGLVTYTTEDNGEYDTFIVDDNYVTIFYDIHENHTVTAIQIISEELEKQREEYFAEPSQALKEGFEYQLFDLTNASRVEHGLSILLWNEPLRSTARNHSTDMAVNGYFNHTNLEGESPFDRMTKDAITYSMAGENLAAGQPSSIFAHEGLMNSAGHRKNKLQAGFESLAVGVDFSEDGQPYYTENYLAK